MTCLGELVWIGLELDEFLRRRDRLGLRPDPSFGDRYGLSENEELDEFDAFCRINCGRGRFVQAEWSKDLKVIVRFLQSDPSPVILVQKAVHFDMTVHFKLVQKGPGKFSNV